jgi:methyl-accepting chemotaxis protein
VAKAGSTMAEIVTSVQRVTDIMAEISAASQEQSAGIEQVNQTITQMDETTQQNAALVEEATAAAQPEGAGRRLDECGVGIPHRRRGGRPVVSVPMPCLDFAALGEGAKSPAVAFRAAKPAASCRTAAPTATGVTPEPPSWSPATSGRNSGACLACCVEAWPVCKQRGENERRPGMSGPPRR